MTKLKVKYKGHVINIEIDNDPTLLTIMENIQKIIQELKK